MDLSFATTSLQKECESKRKLRRAYGDACAKQVGVRLDDLEAAASLDDFRNLPGHCHELGADRQGQFALRLPDGKRLIFEPESGDCEAWSDVSAVRILEITDYH